MKYPITPRGYDKLRLELQKLKGMRPDLAKAIEVARGHGDLSENGDYDAAKEKSGMVEAKIRDIEVRLASAEIIDPNKIANHEKIVFGVTVKLSDIESGEEKELSIYGSEESDISKGWISYESPIGKSLIGKQVGDLAQVLIRGAKKEYEILEIYVNYQE